MIALYKDPKGETVFDKYDPPSLKTQQQISNGQQQPPRTESATGTIDSLKKRILELENMLTLNQQQPELEVSLLDILHGVNFFFFTNTPSSLVPRPSHVFQRCPDFSCERHEMDLVYVRG